MLMWYSRLHRKRRKTHLTIETTITWFLPNLTTKPRRRNVKRTIEHMELAGSRHIPIQVEQKPINTRRHSPKWERLSLLCQKTAGQDTYRLPLWLTFRKTWRMNGHRAFSLFCSKNYWKCTLRLNLDGWNSLASGWFRLKFLVAAAHVELTARVHFSVQFC